MYKLLDDTTKIHHAFSNRDKDLFVQEAFCRMAKPNAKLRTYSLIKSTFQREDYLVQIRNTRHRQTLTKLRLSNHKLRIETGRHKKLPPVDRICEICNCGVEDEIHFLVKCPQYDPLRESLLTTCMELRPQFEFYTDQEKFIYMMTTPLLTVPVSKFLEYATNERELFLESKATIDYLLNKMCQ